MTIHATQRQDIYSRFRRITLLLPSAQLNKRCVTSAAAVYMTS
jgi:hypothetical protein